MTTFELMQGSALLLPLALLPGFLICLSLRGTPRELVSLLVCSVGVSLAYLVLLGMGLLALSGFNLTLLAIGCMPLVALAIWRRHRVLGGLRTLHLSGGNGASVGLVLGAFAIMLVATPHWTFLVNIAWDAGNYETYSNHFWRTGTLNLDISEIANRGLPIAWSLSGPTWVSADTSGGLLGPNQLLGFPVYLGLIKLIFQQPDVAWIAMALLALVSTGLLALLASRLSGRWWLGALVTLAVLATPLFYFYSKLVMSEQLGLLGLLLAAFALVEAEHSEDQDAEAAWGQQLLVFCGLLLTFLTKLDAFPFALFFVAVMALAVTEQPQRSAPYVRSGMAVAAAFAVAAVLNTLFVEPAYLAKFSVDAISNLLPIPFILIYAALVLGIAFAARAWTQRRPQALAAPAFTGTLTAAVTIAICASWMLFMLWAWMLRPLEWSGNLLENHDLVNLIRLGPVSSPVLLAITLLGFPVVFAKASPSLRYLLLIFGAFLCYMLWKSYHSPYELIWMRRYLMALIPTMTLVTAAAAGLLVSHRVSVAPALAAGLAGLIAVQLLYLEPLLKHELNTQSAKQVLALNQRIPNQSLLVVNNTPEADEQPETPSWLLRGAGNTLRSLRDGPTLLNVPDEALEQAITAFPEVGHAVVITVQPPPGPLRDKLNLQFDGQLPVSTQYSSWLARIRQDPTKARTINVYIFSGPIAEADNPS